MELRASEIGPDPSGANVGERVGLGMPVEEDWDPQLTPDAVAQLVRQLASGVGRGAAQRDDRNHVSRSHARMDTAVLANVDLLDGRLRR